MASPILFRDTDSGAPVLSGSAGAMINVLSGCLCILKQFGAISGGTFVDNTTEARLQGGTAFKLFAGPTVTVDEAYFGLQRPFDRLALVFGTAGVQNTTITLAWEYWNGSAWTALTVTDGTTKLTVNGSVTWTIPGTWATTAVNGTTCYWVRVRFTAGTWTTNPLVNTASLTGWTEAFSAANIRIYQPGGGNQFYFRVQDDGNTWLTGTPSTATTKEALYRWSEGASAIGTTTGDFPTVAQLAQGMVLRKSATADATARSWLLLADDRTIAFLGVLTTDNTNTYLANHCGDFFSLVTSDAFRTAISGRVTTNSSSASSSADALALTTPPNGTVAGAYAARAYTGVGTAIALGKQTDAAKKGGTAVDLTAAGLVPYPNGPDSGLYIAPVWISELTGGNAHIRGRLRGLWSLLHASVASFSDGDVFAGTGALAGKSFLIVKAVTNGSAPVLVLETSDTWETN